jgi:predicted nucleotidyltransferase
MPRSRLTIPTNELNAFCHRHHIRKLALFGPVLRDDFNETSDIDVLVEFDPDHIPGLAFFAMEEELSALLGWTVDLNTPDFLPIRIRERVVAEANVLYDAA